MPRRRSIRTGSSTVHLAFTVAGDGDLRVDSEPSGLVARRERVAPGEWTWLHQVHGDRVVVAEAPGDGAGSRADAAVTAVPGSVLAVHTADCAGVLLWASDGVAAAGAAHAGWRGLQAGVLEATVQALQALGAEGIRYQIGPCISPGAYEFGEEDLAGLVRRLGPEVAARSERGGPALDLRAGVRAALSSVGAREDADGPVPCTASDPGWYSWRARRDEARQAAVIWMEA